MAEPGNRPCLRCPGTPGRRLAGLAPRPQRQWARRPFARQRRRRGSHLRACAGEPSAAAARQCCSSAADRVACGSLPSWPACLHAHLGGMPTPPSPRCVLMAPGHAALLADALGRGANHLRPCALWQRGGQRGRHSVRACAQRRRRRRRSPHPGHRERAWGRDHQPRLPGCLPSRPWGQPRAEPWPEPQPWPEPWPQPQPWVQPRPGPHAGSWPRRLLVARSRGVAGGGALGGARTGGAAALPSAGPGGCHLRHSAPLQQHLLLAPHVSCLAAWLADGCLHYTCPRPACSTLLAACPGTGNSDSFSDFLGVCPRLTLS